jgi:hypothetical protein
MQEPYVWYHVAGCRWCPGQPLLCWSRLKEGGLVTDADWAHPAVEVGYDGHLISFFPTLSDARQYAQWRPRRGEAIVRVRFPPDRQKIVYNAEEVACYPGGQIPADWVQVVADDEEEWFPEGMRRP